MRKNDVELTRKHLKNLFQREGLTYKDVAHQLHVSEITVKRWMSGQSELSLETLSKLCRCVNLSAIDFFKSIKTVTKESSFRVLTAQEENYFIKNKDCLGFLYTLLVTRSLEKAQKELHIPKPRLYRYLNTLDRMGFLKWGKDDIITLIPEVAITYKRGNPMHKYFAQKARDDFFDYLFEKKNEFNTGLSVRMTEESAAEVVRMIKKVETYMLNNEVDDDYPNSKRYGSLLGFREGETPTYKIFQEKARKGEKE